MDLELVGTGGRSGWPEPGCPCASCALAGAAPRAPLALRVDGRPVPALDGELADRTCLLALDQGVVRRSPQPYAVVLLGDADLALLARLRAAGAVGPATDVVAVGLTHRHRPGFEATLADCGVRVLADGARVHRLAPAPVPRRTLVLGGTRSGKSAEAERRLLGEPEVVYVATAPQRTRDEEWSRRIALHRDRRPEGWTTLETTELEPLLGTAGPPLLVDDLGLLLATLVDAADAWEGAGLDAVHARLDALVAAWRATRRRVVAVAPEVGSGVVPATRSGRVFTDELGRLTARIAAESERVVGVRAGRLLVL